MQRTTSSSNVGVAEDFDELQTIIDSAGHARTKPFTGGKVKNNYFDGLPVSKLHIAIFFIIMLAYFFEQVDNWNFGFIAPAMMKSGLGSLATLNQGDIATITFWYFIAMTAGGFMGGVISDIIGRRKTFIFAMLTFSVASIVTGFTDSLTIFIIARALTGFGVFCLMVCSQTYIAEMAPAESRGKWQGLIAAIGFIAVPVTALLCRMVIPLSSEAWRYVLYFGGAGVLGAILAIWYAKESPRWLVSQNRIAEAEEIVKEMTGRDIDLSDAVKNISQQPSIKEILLGMFTKKYIKRTLILLAVFVCTTPASFTVVVWTTNLLNLKGFAMNETLTAMILISCGVPLGCFLASRIADMGGRKIPLAVVCVGAAVMAYIFAQLESYVGLIICGILLNVFVMACFFILFSYTAESYPTHMRNTATGFHNGIARLAVAGFQPLIPLILNHSGPGGAFIAVCVLMALPVPFILIWGDRTSQRPLEDIS